MKATRHALRLLAAALGILAALAATGCSMPHLAGTNDAELEYSEVTNVAQPELAAFGVKARLSAAQVAAEVEVVNRTGDASPRRSEWGGVEPTHSNGDVRVVVDSDVAGGVDELILWRGGMTAYLMDEAGGPDVDPTHREGLQPGWAQAPDGTTDRWWQGTAEALQKAIREAKPEQGRGYFVERMPGGLWRTRAVFTPELVTLGLSQTPITSIQLAAHGRSLAFTFGPDARAAIETVRATHPNARVVLARNHSLLATVPIADALASPLVLSFGDDVAAFTRAYHAKLLLGSPILPPLKRLVAERVHPNWGVGAACALLPFALSFAWLSFVRRFDRARPEPMWLVAATFALGCLSMIPAAFAEAGLASLSQWLDPSLVTMGGQLWALPLAIPIFTLTVGFVEEGAKLLAAWSLAGHRREFDEPVDGIVYGCAAALGFAAVENVKYFALGRMAGTVIALRAIVTVPAHMFFGALWGYALGRTLVSRRANVLLFLSLSALAHGIFDALLNTDGMMLYAGLLVVALSVAFVEVLRRALRHGAVPPAPYAARRHLRGSASAWSAPEGAPPQTEPLPVSVLQRAYFRVGSPAAFAACATGMVTCAFALTIVGTWYEFLHHRVGVAFVVIAAAILAAFGALGNGAASTIPLDVAIDAHGVTYSGARTPWSAIALVDVEAVGRRALVRLHTMSGIVRLGPTSPAHANAIAVAVRAAKA
jgi:protease PrsW